MKRLQVYLAAPLFNAAERLLNLVLRDCLLPHVNVYLPQLEGTLLAEAVQAGADPVATARRIFASDTQAIDHSDALLIVLNGRTVDEGAAFELGVAWAKGKVCAAFKDDARQLLPTGDNPMIANALCELLPTHEAVSRWAEKLAMTTNAVTVEDKQPLMSKPP